MNCAIKRQERAYWQERVEKAKRDGEPIENTTVQNKEFPLLKPTYKDIMALIVCDSERLYCLTADSDQVS